MSLSGGDPRSPGSVIAIVLGFLVLLVLGALAISQGWVK